MKGWLALIFLGTAVTSVHAQKGRPNGESFAAPEGSALWRHERTGFALPEKLGDLSLQEGYDYQAPALGVSLRYLSEELHARADVYVYPCSQAHGNDEEILEALKDEAGSVLAELELMRKRGGYSNIVNDEASIKGMDLTSGEKSGQLTMPIHFTINEESGAGVTPTRVESMLGLMIFRDHWVKLRFTLPAVAGKTGEEARDKFVKQVFRCVIASDWRKDLQGWIAAYRKDRLGKAGKENAARILAYADEFPLVNLTIGDSVVNFAAGCKKQSTQAAEDVLGAFVVGVTESQVDGNPKAESILAGVREVDALCGVWKKKDPSFTPPSLKDLEAGALKENKVEAPKAKPGRNSGNLDLD